METVTILLGARPSALPGTAVVTSLRQPSPTASTKPSSVAGANLWDRSARAVRTATAVPAKRRCTPRKPGRSSPTRTRGRTVQLSPRRCQPKRSKRLWKCVGSTCQIGSRRRAGGSGRERQTEMDPRTFPPSEPLYRTRSWWATTTLVLLVTSVYAKTSKWSNPDARRYSGPLCWPNGHTSTSPQTARA